VESLTPQYEKGAMLAKNCCGLLEKNGVQEIRNEEEEEQTELVQRPDGGLSNCPSYGRQVKRKKKRVQDLIATLNRCTSSIH
jgi:hypothetical protein